MNLIAVLKQVIAAFGVALLFAWVAADVCPAQQLSQAIRSSVETRDGAPSAWQSDGPAPIEPGISLAEWNDNLDRIEFLDAHWENSTNTLPDELKPLPPLEDEVSFPTEEVTFVTRSPTDLPIDRAQSTNLLHHIVTDHGHFYSRNSLGLLVAGLGVGAALANSNADDFISRDWYQESIRNAKTDDYFDTIHNMKVFGEGKYAVPIYALAAGGGLLFSETEFLDAPAEWGERSLRSVLVGGPPMLMMQWIVGGSRPGESESKSHWEPFHDNNGVSGHAFMGAIPFLNAANMTEDPWLRTAFYIGSGMAGLSRVNDDSHYTSQAVLGWWMAYLAARSVHNSQIGASITPLVQLTPDGNSLLGFEYRW